LAGNPPNLCTPSVPARVTPLPDFEEVFREHYTALYRYAFGLVRDEPQARDVVSDVFLEVWSRYPTLTIQHSLRSYLFTCVKHAALKALKVNANIERIDESTFEYAATAGTPHDVLISTEATRFIEGLIASLPALQQEILELKLFGLRNTEVADVLGITTAKVEYHLEAAIDILQRRIKRSDKHHALLTDGLLALHILLILR
jgi:RNA polymerase sigma factor (sigma-70 family)